MLERITASLSSLAPAEQRVAKLVLTDRLIDATVPLSMEGAEEEIIQDTSADEEEETH